MNQFDVIVIGGGPGGYVAAIRASQLGMKTALVEKEHLGGVCLNWGCIPTKALLRSAEIKQLIDHADDFGIEVKDVKINLEKIVARSRTISGQLAAGIKHLLKKNKVTVYDGHGRFEKSGTLVVTGQDGKKEILTGKHIIIATGARARLLPNVAEHPRIWTAKQAMTPSFTPESLLIVGSGAIGIEFASFYKILGVEVTVVEMQDKILPQEDVEISTLALKNFSKQGIKFHLSSTVKDIKTTDKNVTVTIESSDKKSQTLTIDAVIVAIGIVGNTEDLGLEKTKVKVDRGQIITNEWCATDEPGIYAIGDVAGAPWLAHKASHEGIICIEKIAGVKDVHPMKKDLIPGCTYSLPQVASVGLTEDKAKVAGHELKIGRFPFKGNGKALALGESEGLVKTIFDAKTGELLGAHMIGSEVTELIQGFTIAKTLETTEKELMHTIFPHPTLSEMMHEAVLDAYGKVIHF
jgi:dihydrolipoamide dehydrogenase